MRKLRLRMGQADGLSRWTENTATKQNPGPLRALHPGGWRGDNIHSENVACKGGKAVGQQEAWREMCVGGCVWGVLYECVCEICVWSVWCVCVECMWCVCRLCVCDVCGVSVCGAYVCAVCVVCVCVCMM